MPENAMRMPRHLCDRPLLPLYLGVMTLEEWYRTQPAPSLPAEVGDWCVAHLEAPVETHWHTEICERICRDLGIDLDDPNSRHFAEKLLSDTYPIIAFGNVRDAVHFALRWCET